MEIEKPKWLTKGFIKKTLESGKTYTVVIEDLEISMPVPKGDSYVCDIYGVKVEYRRSNDPNILQKTSLILKSPQKGKLADEILELGFMKKEVMVYKELSPKLKLIYREFNYDNVIDNHILVDSYFSTEENVVILEDLKFKGFKIADRLKQLDYGHCVLALKTLAKFHAGTVVLHEREPKLVEKIGEETIFRDDKKEKFSEMIINNFLMYSNEFKMWSSINKYSKWFEDNGGRMWDILCDVVRCNINEFNVLNHGDYWVSNMLFKYDENDKPTKMIPVDFQISRYSSPALDFLYFIYGSVQEDIRFQNYDEFINIYVKELNMNLEKYGSIKNLKESEFRKLLTDRKYFALFSTLNLLPIVIADPNKIKILEIKDKSMDDFKSIDDHPLKFYYRNEKYIEILTKRFQEFEEDGLISAIS